MVLKRLKDFPQARCKFNTWQTIMEFQFIDSNNEGRPDPSA